MSTVRGQAPCVSHRANRELFERPAPDDTVAAALEYISTETALALIATLPRDQAEIVVLRVVVGLDANGVDGSLARAPAWSGSRRTAACERSASAWPT